MYTELPLILKIAFSSTRLLPVLGRCRANASVKKLLLTSGAPEAVLAIRLGKPWPTQTRARPTQTARVIPMIPAYRYTTPVGLPKICLAFDWPTQMKIPRTAPAVHPRAYSFIQCVIMLYARSRTYCPRMTYRIMPRDDVSK